MAPHVTEAPRPEPSGDVRRLERAPRRARPFVNEHVGSQGTVIAMLAYMSTANRTPSGARATESGDTSRLAANGAGPKPRELAPVVHHGHAATLDIWSGVAAGAAGGSAAGPPGMLAGAVLGGMVGAAAVFAIDRTAAATRANDEQLDHDIGVIGGDLGNVQPPSDGEPDLRSAEDQFFNGPLSGPPDGRA